MIEIRPEEWSGALLAEIDAAFAQHAKSDTSAGLVTPQESARDGVFCRVYRDGEPVAWYVLRGIVHDKTREAEIALAHGRARFDLVRDVLPLIEHQCRAFDAVRITTRRQGLIKKLVADGYTVDSVTLRKRGKNDSAT